jgi:hypothetical protein
LFLIKGSKPYRMALEVRDECHLGSIPFALQISAAPEEVPGCPVDFCSCKIDIHAIHGAHKGFASMELA